VTEMIEVTEEVLAQRAAEARRAAYEARQAARHVGARLFDADGNPISVEQFEGELKAGREQQASAAAWAEERRKQQAAEAAEAARVHAEQERREQAARAEAFKARKLGDWLASGYGTEQEFNAQWEQIRRDLFAAQQQPDDDYLKRRKLASGQYT
jgi:hypothetical protein